MATKDVSVLAVTKNTQTRLSKANNDKVKWDIPAGSNMNWLVVFEDESPFDDYFFHSGNKVPNNIVVAADPNKSYKYNVYLSAAFHVDPNIVIE